jgi:hypothetical protein
VSGRSLSDHRSQVPGLGAGRGPVLVLTASSRARPAASIRPAWATYAKGKAPGVSGHLGLRRVVVHGRSAAQEKQKLTAAGPGGSCAGAEPASRRLPSGAARPPMRSCRDAGKIDEPPGGQFSEIGRSMARRQGRRRAPHRDHGGRSNRAPSPEHLNGRAQRTPATGVGTPACVVPVRGPVRGSSCGTPSHRARARPGPRSVSR